MKTFTPSAATPPTPVALTLLCGLAFLPCVLHLVRHDLLVTNPITAFGPVAAGFWFAAMVRDVRVNFTLLGMLITVLLWSVNWLMLAGSDCCSTMH